MKYKPLHKRGISIGQIARRTGLAVSAIRYYEDAGLITPDRTASGQRQFDRADLRRLSFIRIAQALGFPLSRIRAALDTLPQRKAPTKADWSRLSTEFRDDIDARIAQLQAMRSKLDGCIGCGCLSLDTCALYNPDDMAAQNGTGPRYLMGDTPASL